MKIAQTENELADYLFNVAAGLKSQAMASPVVTQELREEISKIAGLLYSLQDDAFPEFVKPSN